LCTTIGRRPLKLKRSDKYNEEKCGAETPEKIERAH